MQEFEQKLLKRGYKRWDRAKYGEEDYDVIKVIRDEEYEIMYQIIFRFWDWTQFNRYELSGEDEGAIDLVILPVLDGRADLGISNVANNIQLDIERMEQLAEDYYQFIMERLK